MKTMTEKYQEVLTEWIRSGRRYHLVFEAVRGVKIDGKEIISTMKIGKQVDD